MREGQLQKITLISSLWNPRWLGGCGVLFLLGLLVFPSAAGAHAYMDQSYPVQESELEEAPRDIRVQFTEAIDTNVSQLRVEDEDGQVIEAELYGEDERTLVLDVPALEEGVYTVYWQVLSVDTHVTDGSFRFAVGVDLPREGPQETIQIGETETDSDSANQEAENAGPDGWTSMLRVVEGLAIMLVGGWAVFHAFFWNEKGHPFVQRPLPSFLREDRLFILLFVLFILTSIGHIGLRADQLIQGGWTDPDVWKTGVVILTSSSLGWIFLLRMLLVGMLVALSYLPQKRTAWKMIILLAVLMTFSMTGHAFEANTILSHFIHMLAVMTWLAGLIGFTLYSFRVKKCMPALQYMHKQLGLFSTIALAMVLLVSVSGLILSMFYVGTWENVTQSDYGHTLLWKVGLFVLVLVIASFHRLVWLPNLRKVESEGEKEKEITRLFWTLRVELVMITVVLILAGVLATSPPPAELPDLHNH